MNVRAAIERRADDARYRARAGLAQLRRPDLDPERAKLVVGTGRSGTTWLMEILGTDPSALPVFEPAHGWRTPASALRSIRGFHALGRDDAHPELAAYLDRVFRGQMLNRWTVRDATMRRILQADRVVAKMIRFCGAIGWFESHFPTVPVVGVIRHPGAVVASMARADGRWELPAEMLREYGERALGIDVDDLLRGEESDDLMRFATLWAIDNAAMIRSSSPERTLLVGFEELVHDPRAHLTDVLDHVGLDVDLDAVDLDRASSTTVRAGQVPEAQRLGRWKAQLTTAQIDRILEIAESASMPGVGPEPELDMAAIRRAQDSA